MDILDAQESLCRWTLDMAVDGLKDKDIARLLIQEALRVLDLALFYENDI